MRIIIDMQGAQAENKNRGIGRYSLALAQGLVRHSGKHEVILALNGALEDTIEPLRAAFQHELPQTAIRVWRPVTPARHLEPDNDWRRVASEMLYEAFLKSLQPDIVVITSLFEGLGQDAVTSINQLTDLPVAVVLYDLIPFINPSPYLDNPAIKRWYEEKVTFLRKANILLSISESSRQEALTYLDFPKEKVVNISTDADPQFAVRAYTTNQVTSLFQKYGIEKDLVLYTGGIDHRKNIEGLISAYSHLPAFLREQHQLAIVCSMAEPDKTRLKALACSEGLEAHELVLTDFVPEEDLIALYNLCKVFVFPSWHEGFGLPALEAMRCGAVVIGSNTSSLPEVIGIEEALFDPHDLDDITRKLRQVLTDKDLRQHLKQYATEQAKRFSWDYTAKQALAALEETNNQKSSLNKSKKRLKLAFFSPLPPERSGISDYSAELLPELSKYYDIEVVVEQEKISDNWIIENCPKVSHVDFLKKALEYDRIIYHFGNSQFHAYMLPLIESAPGVVILHDFFLSGLAAYNGEYANSPLYYLKTLYSCHGYQAVHRYFHNDDTAWVYPCNKLPISHAKGVIVHSDFSINLASEWYGQDVANKWKIIPLLRKPGKINSEAKNSIRKGLGIDENAFLICSFGMIGKPKLNHRLLASWVESKLSEEKNCILLFVGENEPGEYGQFMKSEIEKSGFEDRIKITGWADSETFVQYLLAADIGVQLRGMTRGETSAAVLDCMNYGLATIVNENGSMSDLKEKSIIKIPDKFTNKDLKDALELLWQDDSLRRETANNARATILENHSPSICAQLYADAIENYYAHDKIRENEFAHKIPKSNTTIATSSDIKSLARAYDYSISASAEMPQLFIDISELVQRDSRSGIQRVVKSILQEWLINPPKGYRIEPIYATNERPGFYYARNFTLNFLECADHILDDEPITYRNGDIFLGLDLNYQIASIQKKFINDMRNTGVHVSYVIYDLLPIQFPQFWEPQHNVKKLHQDWLEIVTSYDGAICISKSVADELRIWHQEHGKPRKRPLNIDWFHLGANVESSNPSKGIPANAENILNLLRARPSFLMVGTLEPRKGHSEVLDSFDKLWQANENINLVIVGKKGWLVDDLVERLSTHPQLDRKLFWLDSISDQYLEKIYEASNCLIAASYGEGFGLPLIEAAQKGLAIIARDIPVFREVVGDYALYFDNNQNKKLSNAIISWLNSQHKNDTSFADKNSWLSWKDSAQGLFSSLIKGLQNE
ncbi:glycosyl transferase family 1 [Idiomarina sp. WRN-38]|nr:glycosyl transferase family 1 [Idiomarina sp. H105]OAE99538.1 glycosyl transferase family 1 [Idiomarina sp. WRN-38]